MDQRIDEVRQQTAETQERNRRPVPVTVKMYAAKWCGVCTQARSWLNEQKIAFAEHDIDLDPGAKETLRRLNPSGGIPTFEIGDRVVVGFNPRSLEQAIGR
jgi:glutaredoxin